ncbi:MAG: DNA mismatch repair protein MutT, partial [Akkermansiaceae bacterium]
PTSAGMTDEITYLFLAEDCVKTDKGGGIAGEDIATHLVAFPDLAAFIRTKEAEGIMVDCKIHACLGAIQLQQHKD